jgi:hypothetical protein
MSHLLLTIRDKLGKAMLESQLAPILQQLEIKLDLKITIKREASTE